MPLYKFQKEDIHFWKKNLNGRGIFAWECGTGKGYLGAMLLKKAEDSGKKTLILTSRSLVEDWKDNARAFGISLNELGGKKQSDSIGIITTYDMAKKLNECFDLIIADECHKIKSSTSKRGRHFQKLAKKSKYVLMMTGTLSNNRDPDEFLNYLWSINTPDIIQSLPPNITRYREEYGKQVKNKHIKFPLWYSSKKGATIINSLMKKYVRVRKLTDEIDMPPYIEKIMRVESEYDVNSQLKALATEMDLNVAMNTKDFHINHALMIGSGIDFITKEIHNNIKLEEIKNIIEKSGQVVVWFYWKAYGKYLGEKIDSSIVIDGDVAPTKRQKIVKEFKEGKFKVLIASQGTLAEGFNIQNANVQIFANIYYDSIKYYQSISRLYRNGQKNRVVTYVLIGKGSLEEAAWKVLSQKMDMQRANSYMSGVLMKRFKEMK